MMDATQETMQCMEVWGGNRSTWSHFTVPGLEIWIYSQPTGASLEGGDVYYLSSCASGRTTRLFIGDVSGHGQEASPTADSLRQIMRQNVNFIDQSKLVRSMNLEFEEVSSLGRFATAVVGTFFLSTGRLTLCNAGHPQPLKYDLNAGQWRLFGSVDGLSSRNLPFGVDRDHDYESENCQLKEGDMVLCYTDALSEAFDEHGDQLGSDGLLKCINMIDVEPHHELIPSLLSSLGALNNSNLKKDDVTMLMLRVTKTRVPLKDELLAPFRLLRRLAGFG